MLTATPDHIAWWWARSVAARQLHTFRGTVTRPPNSGKDITALCDEVRTLPPMPAYGARERPRLPKCPKCVDRARDLEAEGFKVISNPAVM